MIYAGSMAVVVQHASGKRSYGWASDTRRASEVASRLRRRVGGEVVYAIVVQSEALVKTPADWARITPESAGLALVERLV